MIRKQPDSLGQLEGAVGDTGNRDRLNPKR
jgi:hypothetical protein